CAVRAQQRGHAPGKDGQIDVVEKAARADGDAHAARFQDRSRRLERIEVHVVQFHVPCFLPRASSQRKHGPPTRAVRMPMGSSAGAASVRAKTSAPSSRMPPPKNEAGKSQRWSGPPAMRRMWGTTSPTN